MRRAITREEILRATPKTMPYNGAKQASIVQKVFRIPFSALRGDRERWSSLFMGPIWTDDTGQPTNPVYLTRNRLHGVLVGIQTQLSLEKLESMVADVEMAAQFYDNAEWDWDDTGPTQQLVRRTEKALQDIAKAIPDGLKEVKYGYLYR